MNDYTQLLDTLGVTLDELQSSVRTQRLSDARALFAAALMQQPGMSQQKVARILHTTQPGVSLMLRRHECLLMYPHYRSLWQKVASQQRNSSPTGDFSATPYGSGRNDDKQNVEQFK